MKNINILWGIVLSSLFISLHTSAQDVKSENIHGVVFSALDSSSLSGVDILLLPANQWYKTNGEGEFQVSYHQSKHQKLVFYYTGMQTDTLQLELNESKLLHLQIFMRPKTAQLKGVNIESTLKSMSMDMMSMDSKQVVSSRELLKAACCNLSQSFETMPAVDVGFTDAVTGYRQIKLLGLAGANTAITRENIPESRGLASISGLTFTPGLWVESMQLSKGIGSVVNGYEGVAGQINVEWWKPFMMNTPNWYLNIYQDSRGRSEANILYNHSFNEALSTSLFLNTSGTWNKSDENKDEFLDRPLGPTFIGTNRWFWFGKNGLDLQWGIKGVYLDHTGGSLEYDKDEKTSINNPWGYHQKLTRIESWAKIGKVYKNQPWKSFGLQLSGIYHKQNSLYGLREYDGKERRFYANFIYQTILSNTNNKIKMGASYSYNTVQEKFVKENYQYIESVPGVFMEYSYDYKNKIGLVLGLRSDYSSLYGLFVTPRIHVRYAPVKNTVLRASVGRAQRTVTVLAENIGYMASNRQFVISKVDSEGAYGLKPEIAWNMGMSFLQKFSLNYHKGSVLLDYYYTNFQEKVVVDIENPNIVQFYNIDGQSFAHSFQIQLDYNLLDSWDVRLAYRYYLIKTAYKEGLKEIPLMATQRAFLNTDYTTRNNWKFDYTLKWNGEKRIPTYFLRGKKVNNQYSPDFFQMNFQVSKSWHKGHFQWYLGVENLTNYMQPNIILNVNHPYQKGFDASLVWGPGMGRNIYSGIRWKFF